MPFCGGVRSGCSLSSDEVIGSRQKKLDEVSVSVAKLADFIEEGVVDYAKANPGTVVYVSPQGSRIPKIVAEYLNGKVREEIITSKTAPQISELLTKLTNQSGLDIIRIRKPFHTDAPSIQGQWHPFTNRPPSIGPIRPQ
uniref:Large ribosomal subunit protein mL43 n=1 Tax=Knipowitschia caucasica TaxID=637954 RepID=A0AAV2LJZ4_KNICA